jgi:hypothetical protein
MDKVELLADKMMLNIDVCVRQLMILREEVEAIRNLCAKLRDNQIQAGVSTPALSNGLSDAKIVKLINHRAKVEAKRHAK